MIRIMCLDQSRFTGFCHGIPGATMNQPAGDNMGPPVYGTQRLPASLPMSGKLSVFEKWLRDMIHNNEIGRVYFEEPIDAGRRGSFESRVALYGYASMIGVACHREGIPCFAIPMQTWRSEFGVPTQAPKKIKDAAERRAWLKQQTIARCRALGFDPQDDNASDAIGLWSAMSARIIARDAAPTFDFGQRVAL